jgi:anti-sigma B factor antagonist
MDVTVSQQQGVCVVQAGGRIDTLTAKAFGEQLSGLVGSGIERLVIDLAQVAYISSAGFRALLVVARRIEAVDGRLALAGVTGEVRRLFEIAALIDLFAMHATADEAVAHLATPAGT